MPASPDTEWYRFGDGLLGLQSEDDPLRDRFRTVFGECSVPEGSEGGLPQVVCRVSTTSEGLAIVHFDDPQPLDAAHFAVTLFADRAYRVEAEGGGWAVVSSGTDGPTTGVAFRGDVAVAPPSASWRPLVGNLAVNRVLRLQDDVLFLHAASAVVADKGLLLAGEKRAGKTTVSTSLAARGHGFLGDELSAVRLSTRRMLPFRRAISFREGPRSAAVSEALAGDPRPVVEHYPDGEPRRRALPRDLFPDAPAPAADLGAVFFLRSFGKEARAEPFTPAAADAGLLSPFASSLWSVPNGLRSMRLGRLLAGSTCYHLDVGSPDQTADLIEKIMEDECP